MRYVIDCSVAFKWEVPEIGSSRAIQLREDCRQRLVELLVPDIFPIEVANAFYTAEQKGQIAPGQFARRLADVLQVNPIIHQSTGLLPRACLIIRQAVLRIGIYDCLYVALAEREGCPLVTADQKLLRALQHAYPCLVDLASVP